MGAEGRVLAVEGPVDGNRPTALTHWLRAPSVSPPGWQPHHPSPQDSLEEDGSSHHLQWLRAKGRCPIPDPFHTRLPLQPAVSPQPCSSLSPSQGQSGVEQPLHSRRSNNCNNYRSICTLQNRATTYRKQNLNIQSRNRKKCMCMHVCVCMCFE